MRVVPFVLLCLAAAPAVSAATLRPTTSLSTPVVLVSDLFDEAGATAARVLGPAPPPGERIVVEAVQLAAIARQFGVDWRPASSADRAVLDRPGRLLPRETLLDTLAPALARAGAPGLSDIELPGYEAPLIPLSGQPRATVEQLDYQRETGRFSAAMLVSGAAMSPLRLRLSGQVSEIAVIPVPAHPLAGGSVVRAADLMPARVRVATLRGEVVRDAAQAEGMALRRAAPAGQPLPLADLRRPAAVLKGGRVTLELHAPGLAVVAQGVALAAGAIGERIQVLNPVSRMVVEGEVIGPDHVAVAADSVPLPADARAAGAFAAIQ